MATKRADHTNASTGPKQERGRYATLLADGFVIEVGPANKRPAATKSTAAAPAKPEA